MEGPFQRCSASPDTALGSAPGLRHKASRNQFRSKDVNVDAYYKNHCEIRLLFLEGSFISMAVYNQATYSSLIQDLVL